MTSHIIIHLSIKQSNIRYWFYWRRVYFYIVTINDYSGTTKQWRLFLLLLRIMKIICWLKKTFCFLPQKSINGKKIRVIAYLWTSMEKCNFSEYSARFKRSPTAPKRGGVTWIYLSPCTSYMNVLSKHFTYVKLWNFIY